MSIPYSKLSLFLFLIYSSLKICLWWCNGQGKEGKGLFKVVFTKKCECDVWCIFMILKS